MINMASKTLDELKTLIANHERLGKTDSDRYRAAAAELAGRTSADLSLDKTVAVIKAAAQRGTFISYKDVADGNGAAANRVQFRIAKHLLEVSRHAHKLGWPMISAIVVNKMHVVDGKMEPKTLAGFCECARSMDLEVGDEAAFLKSQQQAVFLAAKEGRLS
jgi:hypothetical protein